MSEPVRVTVHDPETGSTDEAVLDPNSYIIVCGEFREVANTQVYANGTTVVTIKKFVQPVSQ